MKILGFLCGALLLTACTAPDGLFLNGTDVQFKTLAEGDAYCGADAGSTLETGDYTLVSWLQGDRVGELFLGELTLVKGKPHDDLHKLPFQLEGQDLYSLAQYESCNSEALRLFRVDEEGQIQPLPFVRAGQSSEWVSTNYLGMLQFEDGRFTFCPYDQVSGAERCDSYVYKTGALHWMPNWEYPDYDFSLTGLDLPDNVVLELVLPKEGQNSDFLASLSFPFHNSYVILDVYEKGYGETLFAFEENIIPAPLYTGWQRIPIQGTMDHWFVDTLITGEHYDYFFGVSNPDKDVAVEDARILLESFKMGGDF